MDDTVEMGKVTERDNRRFGAVRAIAGEDEDDLFLDPVLNGEAWGHSMFLVAGGRIGVDTGVRSTLQDALFDCVPNLVATVKLVAEVQLSFGANGFVLCLQLVPIRQPRRTRHGETNFGITLHLRQFIEEALGISANFTGELQKLVAGGGWDDGKRAAVINQRSPIQFIFELFFKFENGLGYPGAVDAQLMTSFNPAHAGAGRLKYG